MRTALTALSLVLLLAACGGDQPREAPPVSETPPAPAPSTPPDRVVVDHILIGVKSARLPNGTTAPEARVLAYDLMEQLEAGADWAALKTKHSADPPPGGPYTMIASGQPDHARLIFLRREMAKAFGDVGFSLQVGEMGMADYDPQSSPFGYHIIKRVK